MAIAQRGVAQVGYNAGGATITLTPNVAVQAGDVVVAFLANDSGTAGGVNTAPGFTQILDANDGGSVALRVISLYRVAGAGEPASYTFSNAGAVPLSAQITVWSGCNVAASPVDRSTAPVFVSGSAGTTIVLPTITPSVANTVVLYAYALDNGSATMTTPTLTLPVTTTDQGGVSPATGLVVMRCGSEALATTAATGTRTATTTSEPTRGGQVVSLLPDIAPDAPTSNAASEVRPTSFVANWAAAGTGGTPTSYELDVSTDAGFSALVVSALNIGAVTAYAVTGLAPTTAYWYRVRAVNAVGTSASSSAQTLTTATAAASVAPFVMASSLVGGADATGGTLVGGGGVALAGTAGGTAGDTATLATVTALGGTATGTAGTTAGLTRNLQLSGTTPGVAGTAAGLTRNLQLSGTAPGSGTTSGTLTGGVAALAGTASGTGGLSGAFAGAPLAGSAPGTAGVSGTLTAQDALAGTLPGTAGSTGALATTAPPLSGTATGVAGSSATLSLRDALGGTASGTAGSTATLVTATALGGTAPGTAGTTGTLTVPATGWSRRAAASVINNNTVGKPTGTASGDLLVAVVSVANATIAVTPPTGFTEITGAFIGDAGTSTELRFFWKVAGGSEPTTYTFSNASAIYTDVALVAYNPGSGSWATTPPDVATTGTASSITTAGTVLPSVTTTVAGDLLLAALTSPTATWSGSGGLTAAVSSWDGLGVLDATITAAGGSGTLTAIPNANQTGTSIIGVVAFKLAVATGLAGTAPGTAGSTGALTAQVALGGTAPGVAGSTGNLTARDALAGTTGGQAALSGTLTPGTRALAGTAGGAGTTTGTLVGSGLGGTLAGTGGLSGTLTGNRAALSGTSGGVGTLTGALLPGLWAGLRVVAGGGGTTDQSPTPGGFGGTLVAAGGRATNDQTPRPGGVGTIVRPGGRRG